MYNNEPLVSVLLPCYNAEDYIKEALLSIVNQTYHNIEIIAIDDCSKDETFSILKSFELNDNRIKVYRNSKNLRLIETLNKGIDLCSGRYIARMDADDVSHPDRIKQQVNIINKNCEINLVSVFCDYIKENGKFHSRNTHFCCTDSYSSLFMALFESPILHAGVLVDAELLKKYKYRADSKSEHIEDYELWTRMLLNNVKIKVIPKSLYLYRKNLESVSFSYRATQVKNHQICSSEFISNCLNYHIDNNIHSIILSKDNSDYDSLDIQKAFIELDCIKSKFYSKYTNISKESISEIESWVKQRKLKILFLGFIRQKGAWSKVIILALTLQKIHYFFLKKTWENIYSRVQWIVNEKFCWK